MYRSCCYRQDPTVAPNVIWYLQISLVSSVSPSSANITIHFGFVYMPLSFPLSSRVRCLVRSPFARGFRFSFFVLVSFARSVPSFGGLSFARSFVRSFVRRSPSFVRLLRSFVSFSSAPSRFSTQLTYFRVCHEKIGFFS